MSESFENLLVDRNGDIVTITMNRPKSANALSLAHMTEFIAALENIAETDAAGIIIAGNGPIFCAGHDFADMAGADLGFMRELLTTCAELMQLVSRVPQVVVARIHGIATAAGCQLVAASDLAVAAESATFAAPGGKGGWFCHTPMVTIGRNLSRKHALELSLTGDPITAETAAQWGLINRVVPDELLIEATDDLIARATRGSRFAKAMGKQTFNTQIELELPQAYRYATEVMASASQTKDAQEGMASFLEKRPPTWTNS